MADDRHLPKWLRGLTPEERERKKQYVRAGIKQLRKFAHGFTPDDGYDLTDLKSIHPSRIAKVMQLTPYLNELRASPHVEKSVSSRKARAALTERTKQDRIRDQKRFVVHVADPDKTRVRVESGRVVEEREVKGGAKIVQTFYPLPETAVSFDHIADMLEEELLKEMPRRGHFVLESETHGSIALQAPMERDRLVREMRSQWTRYDFGDLRADPHQSKGFAESITGFRMVATSVGGADVYATRAPTKRAAYLEHHREMQRQEFGKVKRRLGVRNDRSGRITGKPGRIK